jgi:hypothetical protein
MLKGILLSSFAPPSLPKIGFPSCSSNLAWPGSLAQRLLSRPRKKDSCTGFCKTQGWMNSLTYRDRTCKKKQTRLKSEMENFSESREGRLTNRHPKPARSCAIDKSVVHPKTDY